MQQTTVTVDGTAFRLAADQDVTALRRAIESAARLGGGLVELSLVDDTAVSVLVTPNLPLLVTQRPLPDEVSDTAGTADVFDPDDLDFSRG
jgi:hypothetical protein